MMQSKLKDWSMGKWCFGHIKAFNTDIFVYETYVTRMDSFTQPLPARTDRERLGI